MASVIKRTITVALCASILAACCPEQQVDERGWPTELVLGLVPALEAETMVENMAPLSDFLEAELGIEVTHFVPQDYTGLVEALGAGRADIGMMPPFATMLGARRYDLEPILISVRRGEVGYRAQWMTNDPGICEQPPVADERGHLSCRASLDVLRGETVAFTDANSTSGYLWPVKQLLDYGIDPEKDLHELFVGSHDASVIAVYNGDVRFGVAYDDARDFIRGQYPDIGQKVITFAFSDFIPNDGVQVRPGMPDDLKQAVTDAFVKLTESQAHLPDDEKVLWVLYEIDGFQPVEPGLYDVVADVYDQVSR